MRIVWLALFAVLLAGCGSGGGAAGNNAASGSGPEPMATEAKVDISTLAASPATVLYGVEFVLHLPAGVTVSADPATGEVQANVLQFANSGAFAGARYQPATTAARASIKMVIADTGGFTVGELATLTCTFSPGQTVSAAGFTLDQFIAKDAGGVAMSGITPHFSVRTQ